jgi:predicted HAD superfamily Cof-like phosphohydrolase
MNKNLTLFEDVLLWSKAVGQYIQQNAGVLSYGDGVKEQDLAADIVDEEFIELTEALDCGDIEEIADAIADLVWVCLRMAQAFGIDFDAAWCEVSRTNWAKVGGPKREDGKQLKPPGWKPPDMTKALSADLYERITEAMGLLISERR